MPPPMKSRDAPIDEAVDCVAGGGGCPERADAEQRGADGLEHGHAGGADEAGHNQKAAANAEEAGERADAAAISDELGSVLAREHDVAIAFALARNGA